MAIQDRPNRLRSKTFQARPAQDLDGARRRRAVRRAAQGRRATADRGHAGADRSRAQGRQGFLLLGARAQRRGAVGQGVRSQISRHRRPRRALRRGTDFPAHRPGAGEPHQRGRCRQQHRPGALSRLEEERLARALSPRRCRQTFPGGSGRSGRDARDLVRLDGSHRLQHQSGEARRRAEELRRSARSEMAGQNRQGAIPATAARS